MKCWSVVLSITHSMFCTAFVSSFSSYQASFGEAWPGRLQSHIGCPAGHLSVPGNGCFKHQSTISVTSAIRSISSLHHSFYRQHSLLSFARSAQLWLCFFSHSLRLSAQQSFCYFEA